MAVADDDIGVNGGHVPPPAAELHAGAGPEAWGMHWEAGTGYTVGPGPLQAVRPFLSQMAEPRVVP